MGSFCQLLLHYSEQRALRRFFILPSVSLSGLSVSCRMACLLLRDEDAPMAWRRKAAVAGVAIGAGVLGGIVCVKLYQRWDPDGFDWARLRQDYQEAVARMIQLLRNLRTPDEGFEDTPEVSRSTLLMKVKWLLSIFGSVAAVGEEDSRSGAGWSGQDDDSKSSLISVQ